ncbi:MAG: flagellar export protein FliJ [Pseudomonadota bacterium]
MRTRKLELVTRIAEQRTENAKLSVITAKNRLQENQQQLVQLIEYRKEYAARFVSNGQHGINAKGMQEFREFLVKLDTAIEQQRKMIDDDQRNYKDSLLIWQKTEKQQQGMNRMLDRQHSQAQVELQRREQRADDEGSSNKALRSGSNS